VDLEDAGTAVASAAVAVFRVETLRAAGFGVFPAINWWRVSRCRVRA
jgi:hypothetical protein